MAVRAPQSTRPRNMTPRRQARSSSARRMFRAGSGPESFFRASRGISECPSLLARRAATRVSAATSGRWRWLRATLVDARAVYDRIGGRVLPCLASFWAKYTASVEVRTTVYGESLGDASRAWIVEPRGRHNPLHVVAVRVGRAVAYFPYVIADGAPDETTVRQAIRRAVQRVKRRSAKREGALVKALVFHRSQIPDHWAPHVTRHECSSTDHVYRGARIEVTARKEAGWHDLGRIMVSVAETTRTPALLYRALSAASSRAASSRPSARRTALPTSS